MVMVAQMYLFTCQRTIIRNDTFIVEETRQQFIGNESSTETS